MALSRAYRCINYVELVGRVVGVAVTRLFSVTTADDADGSNPPTVYQLLAPVLLSSQGRLVSRKRNPPHQFVESYL